MAKLYLVRHGRDTGSGGADKDPGLNDEGHGQAAAMTAIMAPLGPLPMIVSPLRRTRETAAPLEAAWGVQAKVVEAVREIPNPAGGVESRMEWLRMIMKGVWADVDASLYLWRQGMIDTLLALTEDTVVVSHFIAINVAVGAAQKDERLRLFRPDNCSITVMETDGAALCVVDLGRNIETAVG
jgi:broad specificity phosphatase PhoE